jgi:hypothetical protein
MIVDSRLRWPLDVTMNLWLLAFSLLLAFLAQVNPEGWFLRAACYAVIAAVIAIPARWIIDGANLREEMRRTLRNPIVLFALISATNFMALAISATVLLKASAHSKFRWAEVWPEARQLWRFGHLSAIWQARPTRVTEILVAGASLAVYALLISQLSHPLAFRRTDEDRIDISIRLMLADQIDAAQRWLRSVRSNNPKSLPEIARAQGMFAIKTGDFGSALQSAQVVASLLRQQISPPPPQDKDDGRLLLAQWAEFFTRTDSGQLFSQAVTFLLKDGISDPCLAAVIPPLIFFELGATRDSKFARRLARGVKRAQLLADATGRPNSDLQMLAEDKARTAQLPLGLTDPPYPLAVSMLEGLRKQLPEAAIRLVTRRQTRSVSGRIVKRVLSGRIVVEDAAQEMGFRRSREIALRDVVELLNEARGWPFTKFPMWLREWLNDDITLRLQQPIRRWAGKDVEAALLDLSRLLTGLINIAEFEQKSSAWPEFIRAQKSGSMTKALKSVSSHQSTSSRDSNEATILKGPVQIRSPRNVEIYRYCVELSNRRRHKDIYVYIDDDAAPSILRAAGRANLEELLSNGDAPSRIIINAHGKTMSTNFGGRWWRRNRPE